MEDWRGADVHSLRALSSALRSPGTVTGGQQHSADGTPIVAAATTASASGDVDSGSRQMMDASTLETDTLSRLLCRVCLRYACRLHSTNPRYPLSAPRRARPVSPPPDPSRAPEVQESSCEEEAAASDSTESSDGDVCSLPPQAAVRRGRRASALHRFIAVAASTCTDCRHSSLLRPAGEEGCVGADAAHWTADHIVLLRLGGGIVGRRNTCWLARFVPGKTCRDVAAYIRAEGWPEGGCAAAVAPLQDAWEPHGGGDEPAALSGLSQAAWAHFPRQQGLSASPGGESSQGIGRAVDFVPCFHQGKCTVEVCRCVRSDIPCEKYCGCARLRWASAGPTHPPEHAAQSSTAVACSGTPGDGIASEREAAPSNAGSQSQVDAELALRSWDWGSVPAAGSQFCPRRAWRKCAAPGRCATDDFPCFASDRECDPDACLSCGAYCHPSTGVDRRQPAGGGSGACLRTRAASGVDFMEKDDPVSGSVAGSRRCRNVQLQVGLQVRLFLGRSEAHGFGLFAAERACQGDFVGEYVGEMVAHDDAHARGQVYDSFGVSYLYTLTRTVGLDACRVGSRMRYVNHSRKRANLQPKLLSICGYIRVALFALRNLTPGEELYFDYGYEEDGWRE